MNIENIKYKEILEYDLLQEKKLWIRIVNDQGKKGELIYIRKIENSSAYSYIIYFDKTKNLYPLNFKERFIPYYGKKTYPDNDINWLIEQELLNKRIG